MEKTGIILFNYGAFGGAPKRFTNLYIHLIKSNPEDFYYFTNLYMYNQIKDIYPEIDTSNIIIIEKSERNKYLIENSKDSPKVYKKVFLDPLGTDEKASLPRKIYWFYKNKLKQFNFYKIIDKYRKELGIKVFCGVFSGVLPLVFYLGKKHPEASIIYTDMDSWFCDVHPDMKKLWYRKYYSYNFALENCDVVDFLSPYIYEGVKKIGVKLKEENVSVSPCSFADYSKCITGRKKHFEIAFCSRLEPDKNPMLYLESARNILSRHPEVKFHLLGEGSIVNELQQFISSNNLGESIRFVFHKNPPEVFSETTIFVSLQKHTNYPSQSLLEAMACGNAVVASDTGDTRLLINEKNGILVPLESERITEAIEKLINNKELALKMGRQGNKDVRAIHNIERYANYFLGVIHQAYNKNFPV